MKVIAVHPNGKAQAWDNATVRRHPEMPHWVDVIADNTAEDERGNDKILAMLPVGTVIVFDRSEDKKLPDGEY